MNASRSLPTLSASLLGALLLAACSSSGGPIAPAMGLSGTVTGPAGDAVVGATVYLIPSTDVPTGAITPAEVLAQTVLDVDEPLEDVVATSGSSLTHALTGSDGSYAFASVPDGSFFVFVKPAATDLEHLAGGNLCRVSVPATSLRATVQDIVISSSPPASAHYLGMSSCLVCHAEYATEKKLAHRLGFRVPGVSSGLQDTSYHPEVDDGLAYFTSAAVYTGGTPVYHYDYDAARGFDKYKTSLTDPTGDGGVVAFILWLWQDSGTDEYKITFENVGNAGDPQSPLERVVALTYGGAVQKQRYMIEWPGLNGLYPVLQFQTQGDDDRYDRTRQVYRDYHLDFYVDDGGTPANVADDLLRTPDVTRNISRNCIGCHAGGYEQYTDGGTGEVLAHVIRDTNGEYDIDGDGFTDDLNTGCENCHGPGSEHVAEQSPRYIVMPELLSPSRSNQLCGRCHNRQLGADAIGGDHPLNAAGEFAPPGISRGEFLAEYVRADRNGPAASDYWTDFLHSKSHHQQYADFIFSKHYRNDKQLLVCSDCHDMHGHTDFPRALVEDPELENTPLCMRCHGATVPFNAQHTLDQTGQSHGPFSTCVDCHMTKTAKSGAGQYGFLLSAATGTAADDTEVYYENDITSHVFDVPRKTNPGVDGVEPTSAMPIPYTKRCGVCHDPSDLQNP